MVWMNFRKVEIVDWTILFWMLFGRDFLVKWLHFSFTFLLIFFIIVAGLSKMSSFTLKGDFFLSLFSLFVSMNLSRWEHHFNTASRIFCAVYLAYLIFSNLNLDGPIPQLLWNTYIIHLSRVSIVSFTGSYNINNLNVVGTLNPVPHLTSNLQVTD